MPSPKLDKDAPYGEIHPPHDGAFFQQDGKFFDAEGNYVRGGAGDKGAAKAAPASSNAADPEDDRIDYVAWYKGEQKVGFFKIKAQMKADGYSDEEILNVKQMRKALEMRGLVEFDGGEDELDDAGGEEG